VSLLSKIAAKLSGLLGTSGIDPDALDARHVARLRRRGMEVGARCRIYSPLPTTEPWLISIGDDVGIAGGVVLLTHDGAARQLRAHRPAIQTLGRIRIGNRCFVGQNAILVPGTTLGDECIVGAGAVVSGTIPANSLVVGNPGRVIGRASLYLERLLQHEDSLDTFGLPQAEREALIRRHFAARETPNAD
jgi:acetyltransferase-like isoleucine patch superfamily enzyme